MVSSHLQTPDLLICLGLRYDSLQHTPPVFLLAPQVLSPMSGGFSQMAQLHMAIPTSFALARHVSFYIQTHRIHVTWYIIFTY